MPSTAIGIPPLDLERVTIEIVGTAPLICHAWSAKARKAMADKQQKRATKGREAKNPFQEFADTLYWMSEKPEEPEGKDIEAGRLGFPAIAFKAAAVDACTSTGAVTKVAARQAFHVSGEMVELLGPAPAMREDVATVGMGAADLRYRAEFEPWGARVPVELNRAVMSVEQMVNLFALAGFAVGVGDWRPQRDGSFGRFKVASEGELEQL